MLAVKLSPSFKIDEYRRMGSKLLYANRIERNWNHCRWTHPRTVSGLTIDYKMQEVRKPIYFHPGVVCDDDRCSI